MRTFQANPDRTRRAGIQEHVGRGMKHIGSVDTLAATLIYEGAALSLFTQGSCERTQALHVHTRGPKNTRRILSKKHPPKCVCVFAQWEQRQQCVPQRARVGETHPEYITYLSNLELFYPTCHKSNRLSAPHTRPCVRAHICNMLAIVFQTLACVFFPRGSR